MKKIQINLGKKIIIDDDDYDKISKRSWNTWKNIDKFGREKYHCPRSTINYKSITLSRFILNATKGLQVDHINRDIFDNRKCNLRLCTASLNCQNKGVYITNKLGIRGIYFDKYHKKYRAEIKINGKKKFLGYFKNKEEASKCFESEKENINWLTQSQ